MKELDKSYLLLETANQLEQFCSQHEDIEWLAFDTEFIPEKYYRYKLCILSVATPRGNFLLDVLKLKDITPFIRLINNPAILKITHAGENDYQILIDNYDAVPVNVFDTQLSFGFLHYDYPIGLQLLLTRVLKIRLDKGQLTSDWERRPLTAEQCRYAVEDVVYLHELMTAIKRRLKKNNKLAWAEEESHRLEDPEYYKSEPLDFLSSGQIVQLSQQQRVFLLRIHMWRHLEAEKENRPVTQVMKTRVLNAIVQKMPHGRASLLKDRTLPIRFIKDNWDTFEMLYKQKIAPHEEDMLKVYSENSEHSNSSLRHDILIDMLQQLIKYKAAEKKVSPKIILSSKELNLLKSNSHYIPSDFKKGWRREFLGDEIFSLLENRKHFEISIKKNKFTVTLNPKNPGSIFKRFFKKQENHDDD